LSATALAPRPAQGPAPGQAAIAIGLMVLSTVGFSVMSALSKSVSPPISTFQVVFFRALFALIPLGLFVALTDGPKLLRTRRPGSHMLRSLAGLASSICYFYAYGRMPLANVAAISFVMPIFVAALSVPLLGERVGMRRTSAILVGFLGVLVMVRPGGDGFTPVSLIMLLGAFLYAIAAIAVRRMSATESSAAIVFYFALTSVVASALTLPWSWSLPSPGQFACLAAIGLIGGLAQISMTRAFGSAPVTVIAPFEYASLLWSTGLGWLFWDEVPDWAVGLGAAIVIASGLYILHRETMLRSRGAAQYDAPHPIARTP